MSMQNKRRRHIVVLAFFLAFAACVAYLAVNPLLTGIPELQAKENVDFADGWTTAEGTSVSLDSLNDIAGFADRGAIIQKQLPDEIESGDELDFISINLTFHVFCDDEEVYAFDPPTDTGGGPYASQFNFVHLSEEDAGKTVSIELYPIYSGGAQLANVRVSQTNVYIQQFVQLHGVALLESVIIVFIGLAVIALHFSLHKVDHGNLNLLALGTIAVLLGTWSATVTLILQLTTGLAPFIGALEYTSLLFVPYPIAIFASSILQPQNRRIYDLAASAFSLCAIGLTVGISLLTGASMHDLLKITHAELALAAALITAEVISSLRVHGIGAFRDAVRSSSAITFSFLVFMACGSADFILYVTSKSVGDAAFFMRHGLFAFTVVLAVDASRASLAYISRAQYADRIELIAYTDSLTNIGNRAAWRLMRDEVDTALAQGTIADAVICQFDVNFLKKVNDTMGHAAGDRYIKHAAETIRRSFGIEGTCYRTGGDEFTAIIAGDALRERVDECTKLFEMSMGEQNADEVPLSMALGCAFVSESEQHTVRGAQQIADERMYANKRAMKAERLE